jgi:capsular exopolysaccharide synthesis family protein
VSTNLAITLASQGTRVLLADFDLYRPHIHRLLRVESAPGLREILVGDIDPERAVRPTHIATLSVLPSRANEDTASATMCSERLSDIFQSLSSEYDLILCDTPPVLAKIDTLHVASCVDAVLLVAAANNARVETVRRAKDFLIATNPNIVGVVLNGASVTFSRHYYYYYQRDPRNGRRERGRWFNR